MKYSVEFSDGVFKETLEVDNHVVSKSWKREDGGEVSGLCSRDLDFAEQLSEVFDKDTLDEIYDKFDNLMIVPDMEDLIIHHDLY
jgi:hypothetical protein